MIYAGIGSRRTPENVLRIMRSIGRSLAQKGLTLRSGRAEGADQAFEVGCDFAKGKKEIFLPWPGFGHGLGMLSDKEISYLTDRAYSIAEYYHPAWDRLSDAGKKLMARNTYQVLGPTETSPKTDFIICYTDRTGGTQQAIRIAKDHNILVFNLWENQADMLNEIAGYLRDKLVCN